MADTEYDELKTEIEFLYNLFLDGDLSEWESNFVDESFSQFERGRSFTPAQLAKIEELYDKYNE